MREKEIESEAFSGLAVDISTRAIFAARARKEITEVSPFSTRLRPLNFLWKRAYKSRGTAGNFGELNEEDSYFFLDCTRRR